eukprot:CAMPEP_0185198774 /NCGR_PEP_ID=MMETSP1140-20130426/43656_1 /TAXON_ID=298111 /ORGANISM="Pavlova sp., Strain CCMP459" /LENGTH=62 /DNA_ID=CAMNT_0027765993 /DNA_START=57 /DNA_END=242 /DNA_ORIENTATION=+
MGKSVESVCARHSASVHGRASIASRGLKNDLGAVRYVSTCAHRTSAPACERTSGEPSPTTIL